MSRWDFDRPSGEAVRQVAAVLADLQRRLEALESRTERLDAHSGEMAGELLDVIDRLDAVASAQARQQGAWAVDLARVEARLTVLEEGED